MVRWWWYGKLAVLDLAETGRQIGEKLFALLSVDQQRELAQFILEKTTSRVNINDMPYQAIFRGKYSIPQKSNHPLTEARAGDLYFCLDHRLVTIREQPIELTVKEFEIFSLLILNPKRVFTYEMLMDLKRGLQLLFPESRSQPYQKPLPEDKGCVGCAKLCEKHL